MFFRSIVVAIVLTLAGMSSAWSQDTYQDDHEDFDYPPKALAIAWVNNWASLRAEPSTKAARLLKVPLHEKVMPTGLTANRQNKIWLQVTARDLVGWIPTN